MDTIHESKEAIRARRLEKLRFWRRACADMSPAMTGYNLTDDANPLFFFHGDFDIGGQYFRRIATEAGQPMVAISPHGLHDDETVPSTIEAMAAARLPEILAARPQGPYKLGGYCNGALIAYEAARQLTAAGHEVELVILLEPSSLNVRPAYRRIHGALSGLIGLTGAKGTRRQEILGVAMKHVWNAGRLTRFKPAEALALVRTLSRRRATRRQHLLEAQAKSPEEVQAELYVQEKHARLTALYSRAISAYLPQPTSLPVVALSTGRDGGGRLTPLYDGSSWNRMCRSFAHVGLPGHHYACLADHSTVVAGHLADILTGKRLAAKAEEPGKPTRWSSLIPWSARPMAG